MRDSSANFFSSGIDQSSSLNGSIIWWKKMSQSETFWGHWLNYLNFGNGGKKFIFWWSKSLISNLSWRNTVAWSPMWNWPNEIHFIVAILWFKIGYPIWLTQLFWGKYLPNFRHGILLILICVQLIKITTTDSVQVKIEILFLRNFQTFSV